jgi:hypothetical protein
VPPHTSTLFGDGTRAPKPAQAAIYRRSTAALLPPRSLLVASRQPIHEEVVMKSHRLFVRRLRRLAIGLVAMGALVPVGAASALREPGSSPSAHSTAAKVGDTPADFPGASRAPSVAPSAPAKVGDTPADFPGASRAPEIAPTTIQVVRPERTVVRDVNDALPIALSGAALLIVLMGAAFLLVRVGLQHRHAVGRSH